MGEKKVYIPALAIGTMAILPTTNIGLLCRLLIIALVFVVFFLQNGFSLSADNSLVCIVLLIMLSFMISSVYGVIISTVVDKSLVVHEAVRLIFNIALLLLIPKLKCNYKTVYISCVIVGMFTAIIGLAQCVFPELIEGILTKVWLTGNKVIERGRPGSIFINPNYGGLAVIVCMPLYIYDYLRMRRKENLIYMIFSFAFIWMTKSRAAMGLFLIIVAYSLLIDFRESGFRVIALFAGIIIIALSLISISGFQIPYQRTLDFTSAFHNGTGGSIYTKVSIAVRYFTHTSLISILMGTISFGALEYNIFDSEWNYLIGYFGVLGIIWYIGLLLYFWRYKRTEKLTRNLYVLIFAFAGVAETVWFCMPVMSTVLLGILGNRNCCQIRGDRGCHNE